MSGVRGWKVPSSRDFCPAVVFLSAESSIGSGSATGIVTNNGSTLSGVSQPTVNSSNQEAASETNPLGPKVPSGNRVGLNFSKSSFPSGNNLYCIVFGWLIPN